MFEFTHTITFKLMVPRGTGKIAHINYLEKLIRGVINLNNSQGIMLVEVREKENEQTKD